MSSAKRWISVGQGEFFKWHEPGQSIEGVYQGLTPGKFGDLGIVDTPTGRCTFPTHTALLNKLGQVKQGAEIRIEYLGKKTGKTGNEYKDFYVGVSAPDDLSSADEPGVPF